MAREVRIPGELIITVNETSQDDGVKSGISSKPATKAYAQGWENIFGSKGPGTVSPDPKTSN